LQLAPKLCRVRGRLVGEAANCSEYWIKNPVTASQRFQLAPGSRAAEWLSQLQKFGLVEALRSQLHGLDVTGSFVLRT